jgi:pimeloyl-ACP methyl ester carboxylesterase
VAGTGDSGLAYIFVPLFLRGQLQVDHFGADAALAIDLPGHGQRADHLPPEVSVSDYTRVVHEIIFQELGLKAPLIAGHSLGGAIALTLALQYQGQPAGLILIGTGARLRVRPDLLEAARTNSLQAILHLKELARAPSNATTGPLAWMNEQTRLEPNSFYRDLAACHAFDIMGRLNEIDLPTLIICGEEDRLTPLKYSQYLHDHLKGSIVRIIAGAGHYVMREQPERVNQTIEEWLCRQK